MRRCFSKGKGPLGFALLIVALLTCQSAADPLLDPLRDFLVNAVTRFVTRGLKGTVEVGALRGSLLSAPVLLDVKLLDPEGEVVAQIEEIRLSYNLKGLLQKRLEVQKVEIIRPWLTLVQEADGNLNLTDLLSAEQPGSAAEESADRRGLPFALVLESVQIHHGEMRLRFPSLPGVRHVEVLEARLSASLDHAGLRAQLQQFSAHAMPADIDIQTLQGVFQTLAGVVRLDDLRLQTNHTLVTAGGVLPGGQQQADFALQMQPLALAELGRLLHNDALQGEVRLALQATGPADALEVRAQGQAGQGSVSLESQLNTVATPLHYEGTLATTHLNLAEVLARQAWQSDITLQLQLQGAGLSPREARGDMRLDIQPSHLGDVQIQPSHVHLAAAPPHIQVQRFDLNTSAARMTASGVFSFAGDTDLQYEFTGNLADVRQLLDAERLAGNLHLQGQARGAWPALNVQGTLQARGLHYQDNRVQALHLSYTGSQLGTQPHLTTRLLAQQLRAETLPVERVELDATYEGAGKQVRFATEVVQTDNTGASARGRLVLNGAPWLMVLEELRLRLPEGTWQAPEPLRVVFGPQRLDFAHVHLVQADASLRLSGAIIGDHLQDVRVQVSQLDLSSLQPLLPLPGAVTGRVRLHLLVSGSLAQPRVQGDVTLQPEPQEAMPFEQLHTTLRYAQQRLQGEVQVQQSGRQVLSLDMRLPLDLSFTAVPLEQRLLQEPLAARLQLKEPRLSALQDWLHTLPTLAGTLQGTLRVQGTYADLDLNAEMQLEQLTVAGMVEDLSAPVRLTADVNMAASVPQVAQTIQQGRLTPEVQTLVVRIPSLQGQLPVAGAPAEGFNVQDVQLHASARLTEAGLQATLQRLQLHTSSFGLPRTDVVLAAQWTPPRLEVTRLHVQQPQSEIQGQGHLTLPDQQLRFQIDIPRLQLDAFPFTLPPELPLVVQGTLTVHGSVASPQVEARLRYAGGQVRADLAAQLQEPVPHYRATLRLDGLDLAHFLPLAQGQLMATVQLQGQGFAAEQRRATLEATVDTDGFTLAPGLTAHLQARLAGATLQVQQLRVRSVPVALTASGTLSATAPVALQYTLTLGDLAPLEPYLGAGLQASGSVTGRVQGALTALRTQGRLRLEHWRYAAWTGQRVQAEFAAAGVPTRPEATLEVRLLEVSRGPALPPSSLHIKGAYTTPQGRFTIAVTEGPYDHTRVAGQVTVDQGLRLLLNTVRMQHRELVWRNVQPIEVTWNAQGTLQVQHLLLRSGAQVLRAQGTLDPQGVLRAQVQVQQLQIQPVVHVFAPQAPVPSGQLNLQLALQGTLEQPEVQGQLRLAALQWQDQKLGEVHATMHLRQETLHTNARWQQQGRDVLQVQGSVGIEAAGALALQVQAAAFDLQLLDLMSPAVTHSAGRLRLDLRLAGTLQQPLAYGRLVVQDGVLQLAATGETYRDIEAQLSFAGDRLDITRLHVSSHSGPLRLTGQVEYAGPDVRQLDITLRAEEFTAMHTPSIEAMVSGVVTVQGSLQAMTAVGSITVPRARIVPDDLPASGPRAVRPWELTVAGVYGPVPEAVAPVNGPEPPASGADVPLPFLRADLQVDIPRNAWIQGPGTAVEVSGSVRIDKDLGAPFVMSGSIETVRGFASFYGKKFDLQEGQVTFTGSPEFNPLLDVTVTKEVADYLITIHVGGRAQKPELALSSTPELPQADIVSLLVIGKTTDRLSSSERVSLASQAQQLAGNLVARQLENILGERFGLDTIEITADDTLGAGSVRVGRYVTQDLFLSYEREFGAEDEGNTVSLEYSLSRRLKLQVTGSDLGETAVDFLWKIDY